MSDAPLDADEIARRGEAIRAKLRARLEGVQLVTPPSKSTAGLTVDTPHELLAALREASRTLLHEIGRVAEEVLAEAEAEANRLVLEAESIRARAKDGQS